MELYCTWTELKAGLISRVMFLQYTEDVLCYHTWAVNDNVVYKCEIEKTTPKNDDQIDFENNYKAACNKPSRDTAPTKFDYSKSAIVLANPAYTTMSSITGNGWVDFVMLAFNGTTVDIRLTVDGVVQLEVNLGDLQSISIYNLVLSGTNAQPFAVGAFSSNSFILQQIQIRFQSSFLIEARRSTGTARSLVAKMIVYKSL